MDTRTPDKEAEAKRVAAGLAEIKDRMPEVYAAVQSRASQIGPKAFGLVRRGLKGEPGCFYAMERGRVVGTPFRQEVMADIAALMVQFGANFICIWSTEVEGSHGAS